MSELIQKHDGRATIRWKLLTGASALALTAYVSATALAKAADADRPLIWLEMSGDMELMQGTSSTFSAPFFTYPAAALADVLSDHANVVGDKSVYGSASFSQKQDPARFAFGGDAEITFQPENSDWLFSAAVRYGRSHSKKHTHYQGPELHKYHPTYPSSPGPRKYAAAFSDTLMNYSEKHSILDFQAGKDVGLGMLGQNGSSTISAGVRFAEFSANSNTHISARPYAYMGRLFNAFVIFHQYFLSGHQDRSFKGIGPSISWNASAALAGNPDRGELMLDWGVSGAILFGRQKAKTDHATSAYYLYFRHGGYNPLYPARSQNNPLRSRSVTVPDVSGFIGLSAKLPHSKISIGYRGDIWFGAVDRGIDVAKKSNLTFNGPYASISIGLGD